jgi:protoporphyrin/coproporphyrin ferrochelatase
MPRRAIVLMNLGAPDRPEAVRPFLVNLFSDPAIIGVPAIVRWPLARLIAARRLKVAADIYDHLGGGSPLLENTEAQARALEAALGDDSRCFIAMRYWHPLTAETVTAVKQWRPDEIVCLPLYPQFSTTTTRSSLAAWRFEAERQSLDVPTRAIEAYPTAPGFIAALAGLIASALDTAAAGGGQVRLLLSAHGLPLKIVQAGDPYPNQIERTAAAVAAALGRAELDWAVCYQSRVGPLKWLGPAADDEIRRAGRDGAAVVIAPISFVSEHSETLVELDRDYRRIATTAGVPAYHRVSAVGSDPCFIAALARLVREAA